MIYRLDLRKYVSPGVDNNTPFYRWYIYKHGYSRKLVHEIISLLGLKKGQKVLDPFCGGGTTLLATSELHIKCVGYDIMPFAVFVSNSKLLRPSVRDIETYERKFLHMTSHLTEEAANFDVITIQKAFDESTLNLLLNIKERVEGIRNDDVRSVLKLAFLKTVDFASKAKKSGGFLRISKQRCPSERAIIDHFNETVLMIKSDIQNNEIHVNGNAQAYLGDSRDLPNGQTFDAVISSPPYPNRHDYTRVYLLEEILGFSESNSEIKKLRYRTLRSHVEARKQFDADGYEQPQELKRILNRLNNRELNNENIVEMLKGYFEDMYLTFKGIKRVLKRGGKVAFVISNARYAGISIPTDELMLKVGEMAGLNPLGLYVLRYRGNSAQQVANYKRNPSRESLIMLKQY